MFHRHINFIINIILFLIILLHFSHKAYACNADSLVVAPSNLADANTPITFSISGCEPGMRVSVAILDSNNDVVNRAGWEFFTSSDGTLARTLQNFMPMEGVNYPFAAKLSIVVFSNTYININREFMVNSGYRRRIQCGDIVPPNSLDCPSECPSVFDFDGGRQMWFCGVIGHNNNNQQNSNEVLINCGSGKTGIRTAIGCITGDTKELFATLLRLAIGIAGGIAFLLIIFGGLRVILSSGNPEGMMEGKEIVTAAIVGLLMIIFSVFILRFIGVDVLKIPGFS